MGLNLTQKIIKNHLVSGKLIAQEPIEIRIDQTLTQDATGTMAYLQFESIGIDKIKTELSVSYVDHNTSQMDFKNPDDHRYLQSIAAKYGIIFSRAGNGICHQVHLERFGKPGKTLLGSDSHTPTGGGIGMIAIGAGGLDVALAMGGASFPLAMPKVVKVVLTGKLNPWCSAKDVIIELLRIETVKGGVGCVYEYCGEGIKSLSVPERATITNMGAELGATTSVFPSDNITKAFLKAQNREQDWIKLNADKNAKYDREIHIDLSSIEPMAAAPHMPDLGVKVTELKGMKVNQVAIGSCTNSSYKDLATAALILKGKKINPDVSLGISPGSRQVFLMLAKEGLLTYLIEAGARILENACGPCIGMGFAPNSKGVSLRTFNRNFKGRSGTKDASIYLVSPEVAVASAIYGEITDPRILGEYPKAKSPKKFVIDDSMFIYPPIDGSRIEILRGPNIAPCPKAEELPEKLVGSVLLKTGDNITTDDIMPAGKYLPLRSNVPEYAKHVFEGIDSEFYGRAKEKNGGFIIGGENYGQGSSREHAALCPMFLGIKAVIVKSFARIHLANLINFGIIPFMFENPQDYDRIKQDDEIIINDIQNQLENGNLVVTQNKTQNYTFTLKHSLNSEEIEVIKAGGRLNLTKKKA
ncbi:MAG: aconitate hydratase [Candidatus Coatesbacteria bacterium]|nr:aconitate hydratase [Candidatus Coatesbacteria bacterium]